MNGTKPSYLLIRSSEDGEPCHFLDKSELNRLLDNPYEEYGVRTFLDSVPAETPMYWKETYGLLLKIEVLKPKVVATRYSLDE